MAFVLVAQESTSPFRARMAVYGLSYLIPFNEHDRNKVGSLDDPIHNFKVPSNEHVFVPGIWVVELFPPSEFASLGEIIQRNSWDKRRRYIFGHKGNKEMLDQSRSEEGRTWWPMAEIANLNTTLWLPDATRAKLPTEFDAVDLNAIQIGTGLTAVLAYFRLTDAASRSVDAVWHEPHEPKLVRGGGRPHAESREFAAYRLTQEARRALHDTARAWMSKRCPGFFTSQGEPQLLMDMLLMDNFDPIPADRVDRLTLAALRAVGLTDYQGFRRTSPHVPQMLLSAVDGQVCPALDPKRTWALWGNREAIAVADGFLEPLGLDMYGDKNHAIAYAADSPMRNFLVMLAISEFLTIIEADYAELRDSARTRHGSFKKSGLQRLRASFLTLSLDLTSVARDVDSFWRTAQNQHGARFILDHAPWIVASDEAEGRKRFTPIDMDAQLEKQHRDQFKQAIAADRDYREILSTVASLGASVDAIKIGRVALLVAAVSLAVAVGTLLVTDVGNHSALCQILNWLGGQCRL